MNADRVQAQRIGRLTPLAEVRAMIDAHAAATPRDIAMSEAANCVLAEAAVAAAASPVGAVALRDGWAVASELMRDAGPYAPMPLDPPPQPVAAFAAMPPGTDAVAPLDAIDVAGGMMQAIAPVAPGEGVLPAGADAQAGVVLRFAGHPLRTIDIAALTAAGISRVSVRQPSMNVALARKGDALLRGIADFVTANVRHGGGLAIIGDDLDAALHDDEADAVIGIGGTGEGRNDRSVTALSRAGRLACHGIGLSPGETAAFGHVDRRPVLLIPGRIDAALACWLMLGHPLLDRLTGAASPAHTAISATLSRKVTSPIGLAEVIPVRCTDGQAEPLASGYLSWQSLTRADGWIVVPAKSEGYPAGSPVSVRPLP